jgi:outer membrane protein OmpA-like peptidoglycan-associated protein
MDRKKCELSKIAKKYALDMTIVDVKVDAPDAAMGANTGEAQPAKPNKEENLGFSVSLKDQENGGHFMSGSDDLVPNAHAYFSEIADEYSYAKQNAKLPANAPADIRHSIEILKNKRILIVGHTDDTGSSRSNADLSERRAKSVAKLFRDAGISDSQIYFQGAGETLPIADNRTEEGRAKNRRVEIVDLTDDTAFRKYLAARKARVDYYRVADSAARHPAPTATDGRGNNAPAATATMTDNKKPIKDKVTAHRDSNGATTATSATAQSAHSVNPKPNAPFDFGGAPVGIKMPSIDIGRLVGERSTFNLISSAQASDAPMSRSCSDDHPRVGNGVKSLRDGREISTAEYMPNLYNTSWSDTVNGHLVALINVAVLRDGGSPAHKPELLLYKNYAQHASPNLKPDYKITPEVNTYQGENALLYRVFVDGPVRCMDIVIPNSGRVATGSWLYYGAQGQTYMAGFNPRIAK